MYYLCLMKEILISLGTVLASLCLTLPVKAENPEHLKQLRETKQCPNCDLSGVDLSGADLSFVVLTGANLSGANLKGANLKNADLSRANLRKADLSYANLNKAYLSNANLHQTKFIGAELSNTSGLPIMTTAVPLKPLKPLPKISLPPLIKPSSPKLIKIKPLPALPQPNFNSNFKVRPLARQPRFNRDFKIRPLAPLTTKKPVKSNSPNIYPEKVKQAFIKGCSKNRGVRMEAPCSCAINKLQEKYTLAEFMEISIDLSEGKTPPTAFMQIVFQCVSEFAPKASPYSPISR